jgi:hypothetical protein
MSDHMMDVYGESCSVGVRRNSKYSWDAYGNFRGQPVQGHGRTESAALRDWKRRAEWRAEP